MVDKSTDHENEVKVVGNLFFCFLTRTILQETWTLMDVKIANVIVKNKSTPIFHGLFFYWL